MGDVQEQREARKLRELFRGRFDQETAVKLIAELGGLSQAVDFVLSENEEQVSAFLKKTPSYLQSIRNDSKLVVSILTNKEETNVRQFVCGTCQKSWWRRVPFRKEVSRCRRCGIKYDALPTEFEFGLGIFHCPCGNEFRGFAYMGITKSACYVCKEEVPVDHMVHPVKKPKGQRSRKPHSCNGYNCYNHYHGTLTAPRNTSSGKSNQRFDTNDSYGQQYNTGDADGQLYNTGDADGRRYYTGDADGQRYNTGDADGRRYNTGDADGQRYDTYDSDGQRYNDSDSASTSSDVPKQSLNRTAPQKKSQAKGARPQNFRTAARAVTEQPICVHPKSKKIPINHVSQRHISTGSTVSTCLSQDSIETQSVSVAWSLHTIDE